MTKNNKLFLKFLRIVEIWYCSQIVQCPKHKLQETSGEASGHAVHD